MKMKCKKLSEKLIVRRAVIWSKQRKVLQAMLCSLLVSLLPIFLSQAADGKEGVLHAESVLIRIIDEIEVPARVSGILTEVKVKEGQAIAEGDLLAKVDDLEARLLAKYAKLEIDIATEAAKNDVAVLIAKSELIHASSKHERLQNAISKRPRSVLKSELEEAAHNMGQARLEVERAQRELKQAGMTKTLKESEYKLSMRKVDIAKIVAPLRGLVMEVLKQRGEWVEPGDTVVKIVRIDRLRAEGLIRAVDVHFPLIDAKVTVSILSDKDKGRQFTGKVVFVNPEVNPVNGLMRIWAEVENPQGELKPGLRGTMSIHALSPQSKQKKAKNETFHRRDKSPLAK